MLACLALIAGGCSYGTPRAATDVTSGGATLHGVVQSDNDDGSSYWFEYGKSRLLGSRTQDRTTDPGASPPYAVQQAISGLEPNTVYRYRLCARDVQGQQEAACNDLAQFRTKFAANALAVQASPGLTPDFDRQTSDYVVRCGSDPVSFAVTAPAGTTVSVDGQSARSGTFSAAVALSPGQRADLSVASGSSTTTHHVRCLPADFPAWSYDLSGTPTQQWTLTGINTPFAGSHYAVFFDAAGVPIWWYEPPGGANPFDVKLLSDNTVAFSDWSVGSFTAAPGRNVQVRRLDGSLARTLQTVGSPTDFHEVQQLPNGHFLVMTYRPRDHVDLSAFGKPSDATVVDGEIQELDGGGSVVWTWNSKDHVALAETGRWFSLNPTTLPDGRDAYDIVHMNAIEPDGDGLLISMRHTDAIYRISRADGHVEWKLGGTLTPQSLSVANDSYKLPFGGQHDVRRLADGTISVHDNRSSLGQSPRAVRFRVDPAARKATRVESFGDPDITSSICCGSARKLGGGGWLVAWGGTSTISEYEDDHSRVFQLHVTQSGSSLYRAFPVPVGRVSAAELRQGMDTMFPR